VKCELLKVEVLEKWVCITCKVMDLTPLGIEWVEIKYNRKRADTV